MYSVKQIQHEWTCRKKVKPWQKKRLTRSWNKTKKLIKHLTSKMERRKGLSKHYYSVLNIIGNGRN